MKRAAKAKEEIKNRLLMHLANYKELEWIIF